MNAAILFCIVSFLLFFFSFLSSPILLSNLFLTNIILGAVDIFTFPPLNVNWTFNGEVVREWTLVRGIFGQTQTDAFSPVFRHVL